MHKEYPRMDAISLPEPDLGSVSLEEVLRKRHSFFGGNPDTPISLAEISTLLGLSLGKRKDRINRNYPSGGALYPVETYMISNALESVGPAVFHYNPSKHILEKLWELSSDFIIKDLGKSPPELQFSTLIVFTSVWYRSAAKYGDLAYLHALLEAGHMSENVLLVATALGLGARPYAGFSDTRLTDLLDLNEEDEQPVHTIALSKGNYADTAIHSDD
jgi:SagB-type dehydrogenase family enzyme